MKNREIQPKTGKKSQIVIHTSNGMNTNQKKDITNVRDKKLPSIFPRLTKVALIYWKNC